MALFLFTAIAEAPTDGRAFEMVQQNPFFLGRDRYQVMNDNLLPSDNHALLFAEDIFGIQPQENKVSIAGEHTNTVWAIRIHTQAQGMKRLMFFGLRRR